MTGFHLIFVHLIDSKFAHCDDKAESTDDKNDDGNEATMEILVTFIIAQYVRLHSDPYPGNLFPTLTKIFTPPDPLCPNLKKEKKLGFGQNPPSLLGQNPQNTYFLFFEPFPKHL